MKKFTEKETKQPHYASNDILRNKLYDLVEESLTPNIDGINEDKLTVSGKEDLVNELMKLVENSSIDAAIDLFKNIKLKEEIVNEKLDPLMEAFNQVNEKNKDK